MKKKMAGGDTLIGMENAEKLDIPIVMERKYFCEGEEAESDCFQLSWHGKSSALREAFTPPAHTLSPCTEESRDWDTTQNLYIEGDNLEVLKLLQNEYGGKIKMIYIDPPYNTGKDFVYTDNFQDSRGNYLKKTGRPGSREAAFGTGAKTDGRYHTAWLNMMYPRLVLAERLLTQDGVIFLSIDDNELDNLKKICDEIFGEDNYVNLISVKTKTSSGASGGGEDKRLKKNTEYVLLYAKDKNKMKLKQPVKRIPLSDYIHEHRADGVGFYYTRILEDAGEKRLISELDGIKVYAHESYRFSTVSEKMKQEHLTEEEVYNLYFEKIFMVTNAQTSLLKKVNAKTPEGQMLISYEYIPRSGRSKGRQTVKYVWNKTLVVWLSDSAEKSADGVFKHTVLGTLWDDISWGRLDLQGGVPFKNGKKPLKLLERMLSMATESGSVVLDFFSGSATTAHAVINLNAQDGGNRKFIMVQLPEAIDEKDAAYGAGYRTICDLGRERIRRAGDSVTPKHFAGEQLRFGSRMEPNIDKGFRVLKLSGADEQRNK